MSTFAPIPQTEPLLVDLFKWYGFNEPLPDSELEEVPDINVNNPIYKKLVVAFQWHAANDRSIFLDLWDEIVLAPMLKDLESPNQTPPLQTAMTWFEYVDNDLLKLLNSETDTETDTENESAESGFDITQFY